jgi:hypothetical protein
MDTLNDAGNGKPILCAIKWVVRENTVTQRMGDGTRKQRSEVYAGRNSVLGGILNSASSQDKPQGGRE